MLKGIRLLETKGTLTTDLCARSGLSGIGVKDAFVTIYTKNFATVSDFYKELLGSENIKFETDEMVVFLPFGGAHTLIQSVPESSMFAKLAGNQTASFAVVGLEQLLESKPQLAAVLTTEQLEGWDEPTKILKDPDGNVVLLASATLVPDADGAEPVRTELVQAAE